MTQFFFYFVDNVNFPILGFRTFALLVIKNNSNILNKAVQFRYEMELAALENSYQENPIPYTSITYY